MIDAAKLKHWIDNFYGYGSWAAPIWFVGYEEGGGDLPEEVNEKLNYFHGNHPSAGQATLCDIRALYREVAFRVEGPRAEVFANLYEHRFDKKAVIHGYWKNLIAFVHGYRNKKLPDPLTYQKTSFASSSSNEAWIQFYPLPSPNNHAWYYAWLDLPGFDFLKSRDRYQEYIYPQRIQAILENIKVYKPQVVLLYGMDNINALKESVQSFFPDSKFKMVKAIPHQIPQHHRAEVDKTILLVTTQIPGLRHGRVETGFDWQAFGKIVRESR
ncbi:MAG TPA: hypothetical protein VIN08_14210 [Ohtaekwangia sp.]|uniref:hypothetical protein n=1 Tax=Ohtaekwangia sp. TaxID=2066019 RepID=UPI002F9516EA